MLGGVFEKIRNRCLENYGLCPSDCLSAAALGWNAILNMSKVELDLISDVKCTCFFFEMTMRAGISCISKRYSKVNSKYLTSYNSKRPIKYITQLNKNNLYGYAM